MFAIPRQTILDDVVAAAELRREEALPFLFGRGASLDQIVGLRVGYLRDVPHIPDSGEESQRLCVWLRKHVPSDGAVVFPLHDLLGRIAGLQIRHVERKEYWDFHLKRSRSGALFFGTPLARAAIWARRRAILCEGVFDWFPPQRVYPETLGVLGTDISYTQIRAIGRLCDSAVFLYDADSAGEEGYARARRMFEESGFRTLTRRAFLPGGKDPGAVWEALGETETRRRLEGAVGWI